jgi:hypothetical protein
LSASGISAEEVDKPDASRKKATAVSAAKIESNGQATRQDAREVVEGLRKLAQQKASLKTPNQAA